jgi:hypothetical protein
VESPGAYLHARRASGTELLRFGAAGATAVLLLTSSGDLFIVAALLGLAALDASAAALTGAAFVATLLRWDSSSLAALAGAQAVLGPAVVVAPIAASVSVAAATFAVLSAAPTGPWAVPFGLAAGVVAAGPAATSPSRFVIRAAAAAVAVGAALLLGQRVDATRRRRLGAVAAAVAVATSLLA